VPETLVVALSGGAARATDAARRLLNSAQPVVFPLAQLADGGRRVLRDRPYDHLALVGAPPEDELGYGLATLIAVLGRPRFVSLVDLEHEQVRSESLLRYVARSAPFTVGQLTASALAIAAQRAAIQFARRAPRVSAPEPELTKLVYLRPSAGAAPAVGGSVTHSHEVIRALCAEGVEVEAFTTDAAIAKTAAQEPDPPCRWRVVRTPRAVNAIAASAAAGGDAMLIRAALRAARSADAIYQRHRRFSLAGTLLAHLTGKPLILEYNGSERFATKYWSSRTPLMGRVAACEDAALKAAARILVVSEIDYRSLVERGIEPERVVVNPNGVDAQRFAIGGGSEMRRRHGIERDRVVLGFVGSFGPWHGAPILAHAFTHAAARDDRLHLLLIGDGRELELTSEILREAGLDDRATVTGQVQPQEIPSYLDACDILVSPHVPLPDGVEFFGSPTKLFEYMAAGKGIIASRLGQIGDVLEHGVTAWLVEPGEVAGLTEALLSLAAAPDLLRELGARARREALERHSWRENAQRITASYREFAAKAAR
jgi:glycosyltransferase involved in cell wall biosynthesis